MYCSIRKLNPRLASGHNIRYLHFLAPSPSPTCDVPVLSVSEGGGDKTAAASVASTAFFSRSRSFLTPPSQSQFLPPSSLPLFLFCPMRSDHRTTQNIRTQSGVVWASFT